MGNPRKRKQNPRKEIEHIYILACKTEIIYINAILSNFKKSDEEKEYKYHIKLFEKFAHPSCIEKIVKISHKPTPDMVYHILDLERVKKKDKQIQSILDYLSEIEKRNKTASYQIKTITQMPSIEFWFLLHFTKCSKQFQNAGECIIEFKKYAKNYDKTKSEEIIKNVIAPKVKKAMENYKLSSKNFSKIEEPTFQKHKITNPMSQIYDFISEYFHKSE